MSERSFPLRMLASVAVAASLALALVGGVNLLFGEAFEGDLYFGEDTYYRGDIVLRGGRTLTVEGGTLVVDGNVTLYDQASLVLLNATLALDARKISVPGEPSVWTDYSVTLHDISRMVMRDATLTRTTSSSWPLDLRDSATFSAERSDMLALLWFHGPGTSVTIRNSTTAFLSFGGASALIEDSIWHGIGAVGGDGTVILRNLEYSETQGPGLLGFRHFTGTMAAENVAWDFRVEVHDGVDAHLHGNISFGPRSSVHIPDWDPDWDLESGTRLTRHFPVQVAMGGNPAVGVPLEVYGPDGILKASATTDTNGFAVLPVTFATVGFDGTEFVTGLDLVAKFEAGGVWQTLRFLSSTPITVQGGS